MGTVGKAESKHSVLTLCVAETQQKVGRQTARQIDRARKRGEQLGGKHELQRKGDGKNRETVAEGEIYRSETAVVGE